MDNLLVSVIIPTYNRSALLAEAINSIILQTYRPIECIVVDDGSTDNTRTIVEQMMQLNDHSFRLIYKFQENSGPQVARNLGTSVSMGSFIQYLDSDDILYSDKIEKQVLYLLNNPASHGVFGDWNTGNLDQVETVTAYKKKDLIAQFLGERCIANFSFLMRKSIVNKIGEWDVLLKRNQEVDFHLRGVLAGGNFGYEPLLGGLWRKHAKPSINSNADLNGVIYFFKKWEKILAEKSLLTAEAKKGIAGNYLWFLGTYQNTPKHQRLAIYKHIYKMLPEYHIFNSRRFKFFNTILGKNLTFKILAFTST